MNFLFETGRTKQETATRMMISSEDSGGGGGGGGGGGNKSSKKRKLRPFHNIHTHSNPLSDNRFVDT